LPFFFFPYTTFFFPVTQVNPSFVFWSPRFLLDLLVSFYQPPPPVINYPLFALPHLIRPCGSPLTKRLPRHDSLLVVCPSQTHRAMVWKSSFFTAPSLKTFPPTGLPSNVESFVFSNHHFSPARYTTDLLNAFPRARVSYFRHTHTPAPPPFERLNFFFSCPVFLFFFVPPSMPRSPVSAALAPFF